MRAGKAQYLPALHRLGAMFRRPNSPGTTQGMGRGVRLWHYGLLAGLAGVLGGWSVAGCRQASEEARQAMESYRRCRTLAGRIRAKMRSEPLLAGPAPRGFEYGAALRRAAVSAGIPQRSFPNPSLGRQRPIGETRYIEQEVIAGIGAVTLPQLIAFLHKLATATPSFQVREIVLEPASRPPGEPAGEWWLPRLTLTYTTVSDLVGR